MKTEERAALLKGGLVIVGKIKFKGFTKTILLPPALTYCNIESCPKLPDITSPFYPGSNRTVLEFIGRDIGLDLGPTMAPDFQLKVVTH